MVFEKVRAIISEQLEIEEDAVTTDLVLDDLGVDSIDIVDIIVRLEEEFDGEIPEEDVETMTSIADIVKYIEDNLV